MGNEMLFKIKDYFEANGVKIRPSIFDNAVLTSWTIEGGHVDVCIQTTKDGKIAHIAAMNFVKVDEEKKDVIYNLLNGLNDEYLFAKFVLDKDSNQVYIKIDTLVDEANCGLVCLKFVQRVVCIAESSYVIFKKTFGESKTMEFKVQL